MSQVNQQAYATAIPNATQYEFMLVPQGGGTTIYHTRHIGFRFNFAWFTDWNYSTTYDVSVRVQTNGNWTAYGPSCPITSPSILTPSIRPQYCGLVMSQVNQQIYATEIVNATEYEFKLVPQGGGTTVYHTRHISFRFNFAWFTGWSVNTIYDISVRVKINGTYTAYGTSCTITSPGTLSKFIYSDNEFTPSKPYNLDEKEISLNIYPNPSQGEFVYLNIQGLNSNSTLTVSDIYGKTILHQTIDSETESYNETLRFDQQLNPGFYMVTVISGDQKITKKLIVR